MKFQVKQLGYLKQAEIELTNLTIICGENNTGKTYVNYAIYGFLKNLYQNVQLDLPEKHFTALLKKGFLKIRLKTIEPSLGKSIQDAAKTYSSSLAKTFSANEDFFSEASFYALLENINKNLAKIYFGNYFANPFSITSERTGVSLFRRELDISKNIEVSDLAEETSRHSIPIQDEMDFAQDLPDLHSKKKSFLVKEYPEILQFLKGIVGGEYKIEEGKTLFTFKQGRKNQKIPLYLSSSTAKSLITLFFYLHHHVKKGDLLIIDEPELNLHPTNQRKMARLFVRLINAGVKVLITTHSDYLIKELNNLIILNNDFEEKKETMKKYQYEKTDILDLNQIKVYIVEKNTLAPAPIDQMGIEVGTFDREILEMNQMFDDMTVNLDFAYEN